MDVQAVPATLASTTFSLPPSPGFTGGSPSPDVSPVAPAPAAVTTVSAPGGGSSGAPAPNPGSALLPPTSADASSSTDRAAKSSTPSLPASIAKLYNEQEQNVEVSFRVEKSPNEIVTVFTDKQTGKVIVQFPSETLVALAQFFQKLDGSVVDKKA